MENETDPELQIVKEVDETNNDETATAGDSGNLVDVSYADEDADSYLEPEDPVASLVDYDTEGPLDSWVPEAQEPTTSEEDGREWWD